jgi:hypothetical protein
MDEPMGDELLIAAVPSVSLANKLRQALVLPGGSHDIYLAYADGYGCRFTGLLISAVGSVDRLIAHCPVPADLEIGSALWRREVRRQRRIAIQVASRLINPGRSGDAIWLNEPEQSLREVPTWIFSLSCVPLTFAWNGRLLHPRPFCPKLFESMAMQPQAPRWIMQRMNLEQIGGSPAPISDSQR